MAVINIRVFHHNADFVSLPEGTIVNPEVLFTEISALGLSTPPLVIERLASGEGIFVEFDRLPEQAALNAIGTVVAGHVGGTTTDQPFIAVSEAATTTTGAAVSKLKLLTPPLDGGTYDIRFSSQIRMTAVVAGDAARAIFSLTASPGAAVVQQDHWGEAVVKAYNGSATIRRTAGQTIEAELSIQEAGPGTGTAEMSKARISIDKIG